GIFSDYDKARNIIEGIGGVIIGIIYIALANTWLRDAERLDEAERKIEALESKNEDLMEKLIKAGVLEAPKQVKPIETKSNDIEKQFVSCPHCGFKNPKGAKECSSCYKPLENK
ncbi:MAG: zinc ribbon domain-containing protein, partial [Acholeplasmatales bacterium]|nr:zinc ribbon domain-containing protein [Acholeplasmatales bacterium]